MTNRERLSKMDNKSLAEEIKKLALVSRPEFVDWEKYLSDSEEKLSYTGIPGKYLPEDDETALALEGKVYDPVDCVVLETMLSGNTPHMIIVAEDGRSVCVPASRVSTANTEFNSEISLPTEYIEEDREFYII